MPDWSAFKREIDRTLDATVKPELLAYFERVVKSWKHRPVFKATKKVTAKAMTIDVKPTGENRKFWEYVSFGTRAHPIPRPGNTRAKVLKFKWGGPGSYKPRTTTSGGYQGPGKASGPVVHLKRVNHPGNKPRNFERHIARWYQKRFTAVMNDAVKRGIKAAKSAAK